ncbi:MFS transporter, partial [Candidatus Sumerlaeota bacterium]|nr:MFS transporter [Candidatus Sumerlaeota bacterium]
MKAKSPKLLIFLTIFIDLLGFGIVLPISGYIAVDYVKTGANVKLTADVNAKAGVIPVADLAAFPEAGTVTVGKGPESRETISYEALDLAAKTLGTNEKPVKRGRDRSPVAEHKAAEDTVELLSPNWPYLIGILSSAFSLCQMLFAPFWGGLSDRVGRRPILLLSLFGSTVSFAIFGLSQSYTMLLVGRIFAGICGANLAAAQAYIADITEE